MRECRHYPKEAHYPGYIEACCGAHVSASACSKEPDCPECAKAAWYWRNEAYREAHSWDYVSCNAVREGERVAKMRERQEAREAREVRRNLALLVSEEIGGLEGLCYCRESQNREPVWCEVCAEIRRLYEAWDVLRD